MEQRPQLLSILLILTFVGSGLSAFSSFMLGMVYDIIPVMRDELGEFFKPDYVDLILSPGRPFWFLLALLSLISVLGAYHMWHLQKKGFHYYSVSQLLLLLFPQLFIPNYPSGFNNLIITAFFIFMYWRFVKIMR